MGEEAGGLNILVEGVGHVYKGGKVALDGINLNIGTGLFGLLGPNGAGKSTLMRIICTLLEPKDGRVLVGGQDTVKARRAARALFGYLPQEFGAWRLQRVGEVLDTLALMSGLSDKKARRQRVAEVLESVGLEEVIDRKVKKLSGGMLRRLGVAQALVHRPKILVVDEPTVGLDPEERLRFRQLMTDLASDHVILFSTHIVADLGSGCSDLAIIVEGKMQFRGSPADLAARATGQVFEMVQSSDLPIDEFETVSTWTAENGARCVRALKKGDHLPEGAFLVDNPTLEEGYLAFMISRGQEMVEVNQ